MKAAIFELPGAASVLRETLEAVGASAEARQLVSEAHLAVIVLADGLPWVFRPSTVDDVLRIIGTAYMASCLSGPTDFYCDFEVEPVTRARIREFLDTLPGRVAARLQ